GAEAVQAEPLGVPGRPQRAMADQAGAEERRRLLVGVALGNRKAEALVGDGVLGVAAVEVVAGEPGLVAEILAPARAVAAAAVRPSQPGDAQTAAARLLDADDLVARNERELRARPLSVDDVQVCAADPARQHADAQPTR